MTNPPIRQSIMQAQAMASQPDSTEVGLVVRGAGHFDAHAMTAELAANFHGELEGRAAYATHIMGRRAQGWQTNELNDIVEFLANSSTLTDPTTSTSLWLSSTQAGDTAAGSGTQQVSICYISADSGYQYQQLCAPFSMQGTARVQLPFTAHAIQWMEAMTGGGNETSLGNITITDSAGTIPYEQISAGGNKSLSARFMVPDSHSAYISEWDAGAISNTMDVRLRATTSTSSRSLNDRYLFQLSMYLPQNSRESEQAPFLRFPARSRIKVSAIPGGASAGVRADASFSIIVLADF